jgi:hypothetical protein
MTYGATLSPRYIKHITSKRWKRWSASWLKRNGRWCRACDTTRSIQVHHLHYRHLGWERERDVTALCAYPCHADVTAECRRLRASGNPRSIEAVTWTYVNRKRTALKLPRRRLQPWPLPVRIFLWIFRK